MDPHSAQRLGTGLTRLLKEYASKLERVREETKGIRQLARDRKQSFFSVTERQAIQWRVSSLNAALTRATREASQLAEQGDVDDLTQMELQIRRAEVEGLLSEIEHLLSME